MQGSVRAMDSRVAVYVLAAFGLHAVLPSVLLSQVGEGRLFRRISRVSNFEFAVHNSGMMFGDGSDNAPLVGYWPRDSFHMQPRETDNGLVFLAKCQGVRMATDTWFDQRNPGYETYGPFVNVVPGRIGDPAAPYDPVFGGEGWGYADSREWIVFSSLDYDERGVDTSGANFPDWPLRWVGGEATYVADAASRASYPPAYRSDEDLFCVIKDTETRSDPMYSGPSGASIPIGVEIQYTIFTWGENCAGDMILMQYDILNRSGQPLDSCFAVYGSGLWLRVLANIVLETRLNGLGDARVYRGEGWRNLVYVEPQNLSNPLWRQYWTATPHPPTMGYAFLETPQGYSGTESGLTRVLLDSLDYWKNDQGTLTFSRFGFQMPDSVRYAMFAGSSRWDSPNPPPGPDEFWPQALLRTGPFRVETGSRARVTIALIFAEDLPDLLLMQDHALRMYRSGFKRPAGPPVPRLAARGLDRGIQLVWDAAAEGAVDPVVPDSLGAPFAGYRLERATREGGPYVEIGRWERDSVLVHEYVDWGGDIGGLKNNKRYYYRLLAFDEGSPRLRLASMESDVIEGENSVVGIPEPDPSNTTATGSDGEYIGGELGEIRSVRLQPREVTSYNQLLSGKPLSVSVNATSDGARFYLSATVEDTVSGRRTSGVIDLNLTVHGTPSIAGMRTGTGWIRDIFGLNAADVGIEYAYEQLAEPFAVSSETASASGADVPVIVRDSAGATGVMTVTPYSVMERDIEVEFRAGGVQNIIARGMFPYLTLALRDARTQAELVHGVDWTIRQTVVADTGTLWFPLNQARYYTSGTLSNGSRWEIGHLLSVYNSSVAFDALDRGKGSGKTPPLFPWASTHHVAQREFQEGDRVILRWRGGVRGRFPKDALLEVTGGAPGETEVTDAMLGGVRIVPNPFYVRDEHEVGSELLYFNNLPEECEIRIYTVALDLVRVLNHKGGSRQEWDLLTEGGELVASQLLLAHIEAPGGASTVKRFAVIVGK